MVQYLYCDKAFLHLKCEELLRIRVKQIDRRNTDMRQKRHSVINLGGIAFWYHSCGAVPPTSKPVGFLAFFMMVYPRVMGSSSGDYHP